MASEEKLLFEPPVGRWTAAGALAGVVVTIVIFVVAVALSDTDQAVIGAAGLVAPFGGAGFGAMVGAVLGGLRAASLEDEQRAAQSIEIRNRASSS